MHLPAPAWRQLMRRAASACRDTPAHPVNARRQHRASSAAASATAAGPTTPPLSISLSPLLAASPPTSVAVGGHRGLGQNPLPPPRTGDTSPPPLHRENTVASLLAAAAAGATFVEVDAQVTADGVAVLWHDDAVLVTGPRGPVALPISALTLAEFRALNRNRAGAFPPASLSSSDSEGWATDGHRLLRTVRGAAAPVVARKSRRAASGATTAPWEVGADDVLPTLEEAVAALPPRLGINVEVKAASLNGLDPADRAAGGRAVRVETARVIRGVLAGLGRVGAARPVLFSSFDARLAGALRSGQGEWPVFLLTEDAAPATGLTAARLGLQGCVVDAAALLQPTVGTPLQAHAVRGEGGGRAGQHGPAQPSISPGALAALTRPPGVQLRLATYGAPNDDPAVVAALVREGVEAVIVDDVGGVVGGLGVK